MEKMKKKKITVTTTIIIIMEPQDKGVEISA